MPKSTSNVTLFATKTQRWAAGAIIAQNTAANTYTKVIDAVPEGTALTDILFRSANTAAINFDIIVCLNSDTEKVKPENARVQVSIAANSGNNGSTAIASLASLVPSLFMLDLNGNRVLAIEEGYSVYVKNTAINTTGAIYVHPIARDY